MNDVRLVPARRLYRARFNQLIMKCHAVLFAFLLLFAVAAAPVHAAGDGLEAELFPPEFLFAQREALGLSEAQLKAMESAMQDARDEFEKLKAKLDERAKALQEVLHQPKPDVKQAEEKLRALLAQEAEVKTLHMLTMLKVRGQLTPEQLEKARKLRDEYAAKAAAESGSRDRLQKKLEQLRDLVKARTDAGELPPEIMERARGIQQLLKEGKETDAERQIDELLGQLAGKPKS